MKNPDLSEWIQRYFQDYLVRQRNVSPATVAAYRDTPSVSCFSIGAGSLGRL